MKKIITFLILFLGFELSAQKAQVLPDSLFFVTERPFPIGKVTIRNRLDKEVKLNPGNYTQNDNDFTTSFSVDERGLFTGKYSVNRHRPEYRELALFENSQVTSVKRRWYNNSRLEQQQDIIVNDTIVYTETKDELGNVSSKEYYYKDKFNNEVKTKYNKNGTIASINDEIKKIEIENDENGVIKKSIAMINGEKIEKNYSSGKLKTLHKQNIYPSKYFERYDENERIEFKETFESEKSITTREYYVNGKLSKKEVSQYLDENKSVRRFKESIYDEKNKLIETKIIEDMRITPKLD